MLMPQHRLHDFMSCMPAPAMPCRLTGKCKLVQHHRQRRHQLASVSLQHIPAPPLPSAPSLPAWHHPAYITSFPPRRPLPVSNSGTVDSSACNTQVSLQHLPSPPPPATLSQAACTFSASTTPPSTSNTNNTVTGSRLQYSAYTICLPFHRHHHHHCHLPLTAHATTTNSTCEPTCSMIRWALPAPWHQKLLQSTRFERAQLADYQGCLLLIRHQQADISGHTAVKLYWYSPTVFPNLLEVHVENEVKRKVGKQNKQQQLRDGPIPLCQPASQPCPA